MFKIIEMSLKNSKYNSYIRQFILEPNYNERWFTIKNDFISLSDFYIDKIGKSVTLMSELDEKTRNWLLMASICKSADDMIEQVWCLV